VHTPQVPLEDLSTAPLLSIGVIVVALLALGATGLRRRDIGY
jgi:putative exporter of polyketide antibiotics